MRLNPDTSQRLVIFKVAGPQSGKVPSIFRRQMGKDAHGLLELSYTKLARGLSACGLAHMGSKCQDAIVIITWH